MSIKDRNKNLQKLLGIIPPDGVTEEPQETSQTNVPEIIKDKKEIVVPSPDKKEKLLHRELRRNKKQLSKMVSIAENVLENSADIATEFQRSRDVEAFSDLLKSMTEVISKRAEIDKALYGKTENTQEGTEIKNQQNIFVGDMRQLNDIIKKGTANIVDVEGETIDDTKKDV